MNYIGFRYLWFAVFTAMGVVLPVLCQAAFTVTDLGTNPPTLLTNALLGSGIVVSNVTYTGNVRAAATFTGGSTIIGFNNGIILSTGKAASVIGPASDTDPASTCWDSSHNGNTDLNNMAGLSSKEGYDQATLSFDFVPTTNYVSFTYAFGSCEYNEYVGNFNDVFAFFINGVNAALIPGTNTYVSINNVNAGDNPAYFINNDPSYAPTCPDPIAGLDTSMHGLTTVLAAGAYVTPGVTNHIEIAIEDVGDCNYDSDVFIEAQSFTISTPLPSPTTNFTPTQTPTNTPINSPIMTNTPTLTPTPTLTLTPTITFTPTLTSTFTNSPTVTNTPTPTNTYTPTCVIHVWPDPYNPNTAVRGSLKFDCLQGASAVNIYTLSGELVKTLNVTATEMEWNGRNTIGYPVATGIYFYVVENGGKALASGKFLLLSGS